MADLRRPPVLTHIFQLHNGETIECPHPDAHRVVDKRTDQAPPETVWEIRTPTGIIRRVWPNELRHWQLVER